MSRMQEQMEEKIIGRFGMTAGGILLFLIEVIEIVVFSAAIILPIRYFLVQPFYVKGASMEPNFYDHEYLVIDEFSFRVRHPIRGEIIVFRYPRDSRQYFIKRLVGLPGETVEISNGKVLIYNEEHPNGMELLEPYLVHESTNGKERVTLGADEYYVLGDNRDESMDSRSFGAVATDEIIGRVWIRGLPISRVGFFEKPQYNF